jgi:hypothetical protein
MKKFLIGTALAAITTAGAAMADGHGTSACLITKTDTNPFFVKMQPKPQVSHCVHTLVKLTATTKHKWQPSRHAL